jgi:putative protein-disulfide isomerase
MVTQTEKKIDHRGVPNPEQNNNNQVDQLMLTYYTDPLCCWSWGFEKTWQRLLSESAGKFQVRYVMGGMIRNWDTYKDPYNSISRPLQMGPVWMHAAQLTDTKINFDIWHKDPPGSSYPACLAVKTAALQSPAAEEFYLYKLREAVMIRQLNIAKQSVLFQVADEVALEIPEHFNSKQFRKDWAKEKAQLLFRSDLELVSMHKIGRFPTLTCTDRSGKGIILVGYRPYEVLRSDLQQMGLFEQPATPSSKY